MQAHRLEIEIPAAVVGYLQMDDDKINKRVNILLLVDLARRGVISFGKAAELADIDKMSLINEMGYMGIPYFDNDISEVLDDVETIERTMNRLSQ